MDSSLPPAQLATDIMRAAERLVFFTGAGISTESGLPDYRGPNGVWTTGKIPTVSDMPRSDRARLDFWQQRRAMYPYMRSRQPNAGHRAIADLVANQRAIAVITQNIDGLHQRSGIPADRVIELHGSTLRLRCVANGHYVDGDEVQALLEHGEIDPRCPECGGELRSDTVLFGESLPKPALEMAARVASIADVMVIVGSSLVVYPAAQLPQIARDRGARLIIIDRAETALDNLADVVVRGEAGSVLVEIVASILGERA